MPRPDWKLGLVGSSERWKQLQTARAAIHGVPSGSGARALTGVTTGVVMAMLVAGAAQRSLGPGEARAIWLLGALLGLGTAWGIFRITDRTPPLHSVGILLSECRLCIVCGYDLSRSPAEADGCTVCGECGAAVRLLPTPTAAVSAPAADDRPAEQA